VSGPIAFWAAHFRGSLFVAAVRRGWAMAGWIFPLAFAIRYGHP
jgi:hypothetical protein